MGFFIGCIIVFVVCIGLVQLIDGSQEKTAKKTSNNFLDKVKEVCYRDNLKYNEPNQIKITLPNNMGYKYAYTNEVAINNSQDVISPALYWIDDDKKKLCFVGLSKSFVVDLEKIEMYTTDGTIEYNSIVKPAGKSVSVSGAIIGGAIAGATGMMIGATKDRDKISSEVEEKDNRKIYIYYKDNEGKIEMFTVEKAFNSEYFCFDEFIRKILPTKSDKYILTHKEQNSNMDKSIEEKLIKIKKLFEDGLISEDDYNEKKKEILKEIN